MEPGARVVVIAGEHTGVVGEFVGEGTKGVSIKPDRARTNLHIPTDGKTPVIELLGERTPSPDPKPRV